MRKDVLEYGPFESNFKLDIVHTTDQQYHVDRTEKILIKKIKANHI